MAEQELPIAKNGKYSNIALRPQPTKGQAGLDDGNYVIVTKTFVEGRPFEGKFGTSYSVGAEYKGEKVSFWLNERDHSEYKNTGGEGDKVKITLVEEKYIKKTGGKGIANRLRFELVQ